MSANDIFPQCTQNCTQLHSNTSMYEFCIFAISVSYSPPNLFRVICKVAACRFHPFVGHEGPWKE